MGSSPLHLGVGMSNIHKGYDVQSEEKKKNLEDSIFNMRSTADECIDQYSNQMKNEINQQQSLDDYHAKIMEWVRGLSKLYDRSGK